MWLFENSEFNEDMVGQYYGYVYCITNLTNNKKYIGKKFFYASKTKQVKGKKKRVKVQSDWLDYYGSNDALKKDVRELGKENFKREILHLCTTKGECGYLEAKEQFDRDVLLSDDYYNIWIMVRTRDVHIKNLKSDVKSANV